MDTRFKSKFTVSVTNGIYTGRSLCTVTVYYNWQDVLIFMRGIREKYRSKYIGMHRGHVMFRYHPVYHDIPLIDVKREDISLHDWIYNIQIAPIVSMPVTFCKSSRNYLDGLRGLD